MRLYHCASARSFRPLWTLEEMGLNYELTVLRFPPRVLEREFLTVNPLGTVPYFIDGEVQMTESAAICQYLATVYGPTPLAVQPTEFGYGAWLNALHQGEATLTFPQTLVLRYEQLEPPERRQPQVAQDYSKWFLARLRWIERLVANDEYVAAGRFTVADISVGYALMLAHVTGLSKHFPTTVLKYWLRVSERAGYQRALEAQKRAGLEQHLDAPA